MNTAQEEVKLTGSSLLDKNGNKMINFMMPDYITKFHLLTLSNEDSKNSA